MRVYCRGRAVIRHNGSGESYTIDRTELDWEEVDLGPESSERRLYQAGLEHPELGNLFWSVLEEPLGAMGERDIDVNGHEVIEDFDFGLEHEPSEDPRTLEAIEWFQANFEDPAERTSYNGREGGYLWNHGGPYDARDEVANHFPDLPDELLDAAVEEIESDGTTEWAGGLEDYTYDPDPYEEPPDNSEISITADSAGSFSINLPGGLSLGPAEPPPQDALDFSVPPQGPGIAFALTPEGVIDIAPQGLVRLEDDVEVSALREVIGGAVGDLLSSLAGTNAYTTLRSAAQRYADALGATPISIDLVYGFGVRLENTRARLEAEFRSGDLPPMPAAAAAALDTALALHGPLVLSTPRGRELADLASEYAEGRAASEEYRTAARLLAEAAAATPNLVASDASAVLMAVNERSTEANPPRSRQVAHSTNRNFLAALVSTAVLGIGALAQTIIVDGIAASGPGVVATGVVTTATNFAWQFLVAHESEIRGLVAASGADMQWLRTFLDNAHAIRARFRM